MATPYDIDRAPEGATHWAPDTLDYAEAWYRKAPEGWYVVNDYWADDVSERPNGRAAINWNTQVYVDLCRPESDLIRLAYPAQKPVRINPKCKSFHYEMHAIAEQAGLVAECPEYPEILYWRDSATGRKVRIGSDLMVQMSGWHFDRWALEPCEGHKLPLTDYKFIALIERLRKEY